MIISWCLFMYSIYTAKFGLTSYCLALFALISMSSLEIIKRKRSVVFFYILQKSKQMSNKSGLT
jgi:hypothetical protein